LGIAVQVFASVETSTCTCLAPKPRISSMAWLEFQTHIWSSLQTRSNSYWIQGGWGPVLLLTHMSVIMSECWSPVRPEPLTVLLGSVPLL